MSMSANRMKHAGLPLAALSVLLTGCATMTNGSDRANDAVAAAQSRSRTVLGAAAAGPVATKDSNFDDGRVKLLPGKFIPTRPVAPAASGSWLRDIKNISLSSSSKGIPVSQVIAVLSARGVNINSELPLHTYIYSGVINATDAENFLQIVLGTVGLDFVVDDVRHVVTIRPVSSRTWFFNVGRRSTSYSAGGGAQGGGQGGGMQGAQQGMAQSGQQSGTGTGNGNGNQAQMGGAMAGGGASGGAGGELNDMDGSLSVRTNDSFWTSLESEIKSRMTILVPVTPSGPTAASIGAMPMPALSASPSGAQPPLPAAALLGIQVSQAGATRTAPAVPPSGPESGVVSYMPRLLGSYAFNPDTGAVSVQAPTWILNTLDAYFTRIQAMYNAEISFEGQLILISNNDSASEGFDVSGFAKWLGGKYSFLAANNPLGGVTISFPDAAGKITTGSANAPTVNGPTLGLARTDGLHLFNAYLQERGKYSVIQRPALATTSGVPAEFKKTTTRYFNTVTQETSSSTTSSSVATKNIINAIELGTVLKVNPRLDMSTGMVRTQLVLTQVTQTGNQQIPQSITSGTTTQTYVATIPIVTRLKYQGETLMKDGDLIIVGGQQEDSANLSENGLPGMEGPNIGGGFTGARSSTLNTQTYYFALQVRINKRK